MFLQDVIISFPLFGDDFVLNPPTHFTVFGHPVYWYAVIVSLGFILATIYLLWRRNDFGLTQDTIMDMFLIIVPCGIIGARVYYVIFNSTNYLGTDKWLNIVKIWEGGLAIYGGIIASIIGIYIFSRIKKIPLPILFDVGSLGLLIGQIIGRWGNFINREAFGAETTLPWRMGLAFYKNQVYVHPTFLYESLWNLIGFIFMHQVSKRRKYNGQIFLIYVAWYGLGRFFIEGLRSDSLYLFNTDIRISQLFAAISFGFACYFLVKNYLNHKRLQEDNN